MREITEAKIQRVVYELKEALTDELVEYLLTNFSSKSAGSPLSNDLILEGMIEQYKSTIPVTYTTNWDDGLITTEARYNKLTNDVTDVGIVETDDMGCLVEEYITLPDGTRIDREDFLLDGEEFE